MTSAIEVHKLEAGYLRVPVLNDIDLTVAKSETVSIVGANGAGKTTLMRTIAGLIKPRSGTVSMNGTDTTTMRADKIVDLGVALVPEGRHVFTGMSVYENLLVGAHSTKKYDALDEIYELFPVLSDRKKQLAGTLSGGEQQMLAIGRALMARPTTLLLDEPSLGLAPLLVEVVFDALQKLRETGLTILLVEQDVELGLEFADRGYVLERGRVAFSGEASSLLHDPRVRESYLGVGDE